MTKRRIISIMIVIAIGLLGVYFVWNNKIKSPINQKSLLKIGAVLPLTSEQLAYPGNRILNGVKLAISEADTTSVQVLFFSEDSKGKTTIAINATQKLIDFNKVKFIIGGMLSSTTNGMLPIVNKNKTLLISPTASSPDLAKPNDFFYRVWPSDKQEAILSSDFCFNELGLKNMAIVYWNNDYSIGLKNSFKENYENLKGKILVEMAYESSATDYSTIITQLKKYNLDGIYLPGIPTSNAHIVKKLKENNSKSTIFSNLAAQEEIFRQIAGEAIENVYFTNLSFDEDLFNNSLFYISYKEKFNEEPDIQSLKGYESAKIILDAFSNGFSKPEDFQQYIDSKEYFSFYSDTLRFDLNGDAIVKYNINKYEAGEIVRIH